MPVSGAVGAFPGSFHRDPRRVTLCISAKPSLPASGRAATRAKSAGKSVQDSPSSSADHNRRIASTPPIPDEGQPTGRKPTPSHQMAKRTASRSLGQP
jgi:hypothetical protein